VHDKCPEPHVPGVLAIADSITVSIIAEHKSEIAKKLKQFP
jgi:hypothetical protein